MTTILDRLRDAYNALDSRNRLRLGYVLIALLVLAIAFSTLSDRIARLERQREGREADLVEMLQLKGKFLEVRALSQRFSNRLAAARGEDSPAKIIEDTGIKGKSIQIAPMKGEERAGFIEEAAEVKVDGLTANEAINLIYRLEKGAKPLIIKKALLRTRFDDPSRLDLVLNVALLRVAAPGGR
ncbi:type II secretion system protein GspM [Geotalea uraniireducens]|uniref:Type II secretion system protein GspM n=1 Tax=Geotalea uraniireducens TaxID=351604 RepID=A0ABN6VWJ7_9BACT|nr:general secretion pathway protein GspM [Geotalea uraniireducens]BDV44776.1 type II secretion system protein GspM [Geotalea uraniireducens]